MSMRGPVPEPEIIIRKIKSRAHAGHHGGAWKVAYADFVTAMMAFFLLMWLLNATDEKKRQGLADYFSPTLLATDKTAGSDGIMGGRSMDEPEHSAPHTKPGGLIEIPPLPKDPGAEQAQLRKVEDEIRKRMERDPGLKALQSQIRLTHTPEGLRIELIDKADYSMFTTGTAQMDPRAEKLLAVVAQSIDDMPNRLAIRGHTDAAPFNNGGSNNWQLSSQRAEVTRSALQRAGVSEDRFSRLEGVADTEPFNARNAFDPRNRRMSVTLLRD